ncbi:MAG: LGFP repeat-containing protein, partial [Dermatophilaceae bacterium]
MTTPSTTTASTSSPASSGSRAASPATPTSKAAPAAPLAAADDPIEQRWLAIGGAASIVGSPVGARGSVAGGQYQGYERGVIWWSAPTGAWDTWGDHWRRYEVMGGPAGVLGFPVGAQEPVGPGFVQSFQGGKIWWSPATGGWDTWGDHWRRYEALGGPLGVLGFPSGGQQPVGPGFVQSFQGGKIWWSPATGGWDTWGDHWRRYEALG